MEKLLANIKFFWIVKFGKMDGILNKTQKWEFGKNEKSKNSKILFFDDFRSSSGKLIKKKAHSMGY